MSQYFAILVAVLVGFEVVRPDFAPVLGAEKSPAPHDEAVKKSQQPEAQHWAFRPVQTPPLPTVRNAGWALTPIDRFILAKLEAHDLKPAAPADRRTWLRRVTVDLTGLPPTFEECEKFAADTSPDAYERAVDRLLASPAYGERWARHWLDVARYSDSKGYVFQEERRYPFAYTYRDYVIRAFNSDLPYDQFIREQIAADLLPSQDKSSLAAMGFLTLGRRFLNNIHDIIDDRIDVVTRGLMGLTVSCARCHDHKYDPVPAKDYYSLYGVFASSVEPRELPLLADRTPGPLGDEFQRRLEQLKAEYVKFEKDHEKELKARNRKFREELKAIQNKIDAHLASHPGSPPRAMVLNDAPSPTNPYVFLRGNPGNRGESVPRQFLAIVAGPDRKPFTQGSGRLELANAIASRDNPLTARVMVNRIWAWHFGQGLVTTPSDFGTRSELPSHPELLDWLAARFVADGWSIKKLHRLIVLSATYRQASSTSEMPSGGKSNDPENRLLSRMNRRRLEFEAMRDSMLFAAGRLDREAGGPAVELFKQPFARRRTIYGFVERQNLPGAFRTFDFAGPDTHCPQRFHTTVPQQALFLMNNPFVQQQAKALANRADSKDPAERIRHMYRHALSRNPDETEVSQALAYLKDDTTPAAWERFAQALLVCNEFMFID